MLENYENHAVIRASVLGLASLFPGLGPITQVLDAALLQKANQVRKERLATFIDELQNGATELTLEVTQKEPWIQACYVTIEAVLRTDREEKIRCFGRLLLAGIGEKPKLDLVREHETFLKILDELTHLEIGMLATLLKYETSQGGGRMFWWGDYIKEITTTFSIRERDVYPLLSRLVRTGTYVLDSETGFSTGSHAGTGIQGSLTSLYYRLAGMIRDRQNGLLSPSRGARTVGGADSE